MPCMQRRMTSLTANSLRLLLANKWETHSSSDRVSLHKLNKGHTMPESKEIESPKEVLRPPRINRINKYQELHKMHCSCRVRASNKFFRMESRGRTAIRAYFCGFRSRSNIAAACLSIEVVAWSDLAGFVRRARVAGKLEHLKYWHARLRTEVQTWGCRASTLFGGFAKESLSICLPKSVCHPKALLDMPFYTKSPRKSERGLLFSISDQIIPAILLGCVLAAASELPRCGPH